MTRSIWLEAYFRHNLGDDLFIWLLCRRYPETTFYYQAPPEFSEKLSQIIPNLRRAPQVRFIDGLLKKARIPFRINSSLRLLVKQWSLATVSIGGSIFQQGPNWPEAVIRMWDSTIRRHPYYVLSANFGPYDDLEYVSAMREFFSSLTDVCFRDQASASLFSDLSNVRVAPDVVFGLTPPSDSRVRPSQTVAISLIDPAARPNLAAYTDSYFDLMHGIIESLVDRKYRVILVAFCEPEGDSRAVGRLLASHADNEAVRSYHYIGNIEEALSILSAADYIIATRFHAVILAMVMGKPVLPICYSAKTNTVLTDLGYTGPCYSLQNLSSLDPTFLVSQLLDDSPFDVSAQAVASNEQFAKLDRLLHQ